LVDSGRIAIAPDIFGQDRLVPLINLVEDGLSDEVRADGVTLESVFFELGAFFIAVIGFGVRFVNI
jgi:hypothetical protein